MTDYEKLSRDELRALADKGDAVAAARLGDTYYNGIGGEKDIVLARKYNEQAARAGNTAAMFNMALLYQKGEGGPSDPTKAREWYEKAAQAGEEAAMFNLGTMYDNGEGGPTDPAKAREWYETAAKAGQAKAMFNLGTMYNNGEGGPADPAKAREWYEKAAKAGNAEAMCNLGVMIVQGEGGPADPAKARKWFEKAAQAGKTNAMFNIALLYQKGKESPADPAKAREWYEKAAQAGDATAMFNLALLVHKGQGGPEDPATARELLEKAARTGYSRAMLFLGIIHLIGDGGPPQHDKAEAWLQQAVEAGIKNAEDLAALFAPEEDQHESAFFRILRGFLAHPLSREYGFLMPLVEEGVSWTPEACSLHFPSLHALHHITKTWLMEQTARVAKDPPATLAHYTSLDATRNILEPERKRREKEKKPDVLRLYNVLYMNDPNEGKTLVRRSRASDKSSLHVFFPEDRGGLPVDPHARMVYGVSFTQADDRLILWRLYGRDASGLCLSLPFEDFRPFLDDGKTLGLGLSKIGSYGLKTASAAAGIAEKSVPKESGEPKAEALEAEEEAAKPTETGESAKDPADFCFLKVVYDDKEMDAFLKRLEPHLKKIAKMLRWEATDDPLRRAVAQAVRMTLLDVLYAFKDAEYSTENEYRLLALCASPHVEKDENSKLYVETPPFLFRNHGGAIIIGPRHEHKVRTQLELHHLIETQLNDEKRTVPITVRQSEIAYR